MKRLFLILALLIVFPATASAGTYDHTVHLSFAGVSMDSVIAYIEVNNVKIDSAKFFVFPNDSVLNIPDTGTVNITYLYYQTGSAGLFETAWEDLHGNPTGGYIDSNLEGFSNPNRVWTVVAVDSSGIDAQVTAQIDVKNTPALTTLQQKTGGSVVFSITDGTFVLVATATGFTFDTNHVAVTGNQTDTVFGFNIPDPGPAGGVDFVKVFLDVGEIKIDTIAGTPTPYTKVEFFLDIVGNPKSISGEWFILPITYPGKPTTAGRVTFVVPANTKMQPPGTHYQLRYEARSRRGRGRVSGIYGNFVVDIIPDPLKIIDAVNVWNASE